MSRDPFLQAAIDEAKVSLSEGGIPIGSVLVSEGKIIGRGHNCRVQTGSAIDHGEMNCLRNAGRLPASVYRHSTIYSTLSPCPMCSGAIMLYKIPHVIVGENRNFLGAEDYMRSQGIRVDVVEDSECIQRKSLSRSSRTSGTRISAFDRLLPIIPVEAAVLHRFGQVLRAKTLTLPEA